jgi:hypothetical protein
MPPLFSVFFCLPFYRSTHTPLFLPLDKNYTSKSTRLWLAQSAQTRMLARIVRVVISSLYFCLYAPTSPPLSFSSLFPLLLSPHHFFLPSWPSLPHTLTHTKTQTVQNSPRLPPPPLLPHGLDPPKRPGAIHLPLRPLRRGHVLSYLRRRLGARQAVCRQAPAIMAAKEYI